MTLEEFLRKTTMQGSIAAYVKRDHAKLAKIAEEAGQEFPSLPEWAGSSACVPRGEIMVAAIYLSRYNDRYYGQ
eukprot:9993994-Karenia_brevis.AAC.1